MKYVILLLNTEAAQSMSEAEGQQWYAREMMRIEVADGAIAQLTVYCTGDWDEARQAEHAGTVTLIRP